MIDPSKRNMTVCRTGSEGVVRTVVEERYDSKFGTITLATLFAGEGI